MKSSHQQPVHLLVRFSDNLFDVGNAIAKHQEVIQKGRSVWFGKLGTPISHKAIDTIKLQIENNVSSYLYLVKGNRRKSTFYKAKIITLTDKFPKNEKDAIPPYYFEKKIARQMKSWIKITDIQTLESSEVKLLKVKSSVLNLEETLFRSSAGLFYVVQKKPNEIGL